MTQQLAASSDAAPSNLTSSKLKLASLIADWAAMLFVSAIGPYRLANPLSLNRDSAEMLYCGQLVAAGKLPYLDIINLNPPLIFYWNAIPAYIASFSGIHAIPSCLFCLWLLCLTNMLSTIAILRGLPTEDRLIQPAAVLATAGAILIVSNTVTFGQREMIFLVCIIPFFWLRFVGWRGGKINNVLAWAVGIIAGAGLCIKPYFLLMPLCSELYWLLTRRKLTLFFRPEIFACLLVAMLYAGHFLLWTDTMRNEFFNRIVPVTLGGYVLYQPFETLTEMLKRGEFWFTAVSVLLALRLRQYCAAVPPLVALTFGGFLVHFLQFKIYTYHMMPMVGAAVMTAITAAPALALALAGKSKSGSVDGARVLTETKVLLIGSVIALAAASAVFAASMLKLTQNRTETITKTLLQPRELLLLKYTRPNESVLCLKTAPEFMFSAVCLKRDVASRYQEYMTLSAAGNMAKSDDKEKSRFGQEMVARTLNDVLEDIDRFKPTVILEPTVNTMDDYRFKDPSFKSKALSAYRFVAHEDDFNIYRRIESITK